MRTYAVVVPHRTQYRFRKGWGTNAAVTVAIHTDATTLTDVAILNIPKAHMID